MLRHDRALSLQNIPDFLRLLDGYRIQATLLAHLRRRPLPCSIGFPTGTAPMPTTWLSSTCVAEPPTDRN
ncbi:MAG: hypothetical protein WAL36_00520 [Pseudolabrys sp.]|jgi:hypothetical protein